jgi:diguanylate cyclase (GGDEF)-like protein
LLLNVAVFYAGVAWFMPEGFLQQIAAVGIAMGLSLVAQFVLVSTEVGGRDKRIAAKDRDLVARNEELLEARRKAQEVATLDDLTGAFNKRHFGELVARHCAIATRGNYTFSICLTQIDDFAGVVGKFGERKADEMLGLFVTVAKSSLREVDFVARLEGHKFGLFLSDAGEDASILAVNRMVDMIHQIRVSDDDPSFRLSTSAGITEFHEKVGEEQMIADADQALGYAVGEGGHRVAAHVHATPSAHKQAADAAAESPAEGAEAPAANPDTPAPSADTPAPSAETPDTST